MGWVSLATVTTFGVCALALAETSAYDLIDTRVLTRSEIMISLSTEEAFKKVSQMAESRSDMRLEALDRALGKGRFGASLRGGAGRNTTNESLPASYGGVGGADGMLNSMMVETSTKIEEEKVDCREYNHTTIADMKEIRTNVVAFNAAASFSRSLVLDAHAKYNFLVKKIDEIRVELHIHKEECKDELERMRAQLITFKADRDVMTEILNMTQCAEPVTDGYLLQCKHCGNRIMLQHKGIQSLLNKLSSKEARERVQGSLGLTFDESVGNTTVPHDINQSGFNSTQNVTEIPESLEISDCVPDQKCVITGSPNCPKLRDRFLGIQQGLVEAVEDLTEDIETKENWCKDQTGAYGRQLDSMSDDMEGEETKFSAALAEQQKNEADAAEQASIHRSKGLAYADEMKVCCKSINGYMSELCALVKIRDQLDKLKNSTGNVKVDCEQDDWRDGQCSVTCGGGVRVDTRAVSVHAAWGGAPCGPVEERQGCNMDDCPVDCITGPWSEWGPCSLECDGGTQQRNLQILVSPKFGGEPCGPTMENQVCNSEPCSEPCLLGPWSDWSDCSRPCDKGSNMKIRRVVKEAVGDGFCPDEEADERMDFQDCEMVSCNSVIRPRRFLSCRFSTKPVDLIVLIDGSGSIGRGDFNVAVHGVQQLIRRMTTTGSDGIPNKFQFFELQVAVILYSGPSSPEGFDKCFGTEAVDLKEECGIQLVSGNMNSPFTTKFQDMAMDLKKVEKPTGGTLTSLALGQAAVILARGRADSQTEVLVLTDGFPSRPRDCKDAARRLRLKQANILWVGIGPWAPMDFLKSMATRPVEENVIQVEYMEDLNQPAAINNIIRAICGVVK